jgi:hypothetical protein
MREIRSTYNILVIKPEGKRTFQRPGVDGRLVLKHIFNKVVE